MSTKKVKKLNKKGLLLAIVFGALSLVGIRSYHNFVEAACTNTGSRGRIEADFSTASSGNYTIWAQAKGPANATIVGGVEGKGCSSAAVTLNTSTWTWVSINPNAKAALNANTGYILNLSTDTAGVSMQNAKLINNECNPNTDSTGCASEVASVNTAPIITGLVQTTASPTNTSTLNFNVIVTDNTNVASVQLINAANNSVIGTMNKGAATNQYVISLSNYSAGTFSFSVRATDDAVPALTSTSHAINVSIATAPTSPSTSLPAGTYDDSATGIVYSTGWNINGNAAGENKYGGSDHWTPTNGSNVTVKFKGTGIIAYSAKAAHHGIYNVTLDGAARANVDTYNPTRIDQVAILSISGLANADHVLVLKNSGTKNAASTNVITAFDRIDVTSSTAPSADIIAPSAPTGLSAIAASGTSVKLNWNASTDNTNGSGIGGYIISRNNTVIATTTGSGTSYIDNGVTAGNSYSYNVKAYDVAKNQSTNSASVNVTTQTSNSAPNGPTSISVYGDKIWWFNNCSSANPCSLSMAWGAATDDSGIIDHYDIYNGSTKLNTSPITGTVYTHYGLIANGRYNYKVFAYDKQGLASSGSAVLSETVTCGTFIFFPYCGVN